MLFWGRKMFTIHPQNIVTTIGILNVVFKKLLLSLKNCGAYKHISSVTYYVHPCGYDPRGLRSVENGSKERKGRKRSSAIYRKNVLHWSRYFASVYFFPLSMNTMRVVFDLFLSVHHYLREENNVEEKHYSATSDKGGRLPIENKVSCRDSIPRTPQKHESGCNTISRASPVI